MKLTSLLRGIAAASLLLPALSYGQGILTPPNAVYTYPNERALTPGGVPTPSMKTLMQIDAGEHIPSRDADNTNLNGSLGYYLLAAPGRYYLTENLDKRILITAENVTLDLGGFEVRYTGVGTGPIAIEAQSGVAGTVNRTKVINGRVRGTWSQGVKLNDDSVVSDVDVSGINNYCIRVGDDSLVHQCRVRGAWVQSPQSPPPGPFSGIYAEEASVITSCTATAIGGIGIMGTDNVRIADCTVNLVAGCGIVTAHNASVGGCSVRTCGSTGFDLNQGSVLMNSSAINNGDPGVHVRNGCALHNVTSLNNMDHGFWVENTAVPNGPVVFDNATNFVQCVAQGNIGDGFHATSDCSFTHCTADKNGSAGQIGGPPASGDGFNFSDKCRFTNCVASNNVRSGFFGGNGNTIDQCSASSNGAYGVQVASDQNIVTRNTFRSNTTAPVQPVPANGIAPLQLPFGATNPFANFGL
ncbi:MAG: hypothetical protein RLZZ476_444 [Verrucomicrobiota bacterium]|jgi:parallel beta-helix repeat protein